MKPTLTTTFAIAFMLVASPVFALGSSGGDSNTSVEIGGKPYKPEITKMEDLNEHSIELRHTKTGRDDFYFESFGFWLNDTELYVSREVRNGKITGLTAGMANIFINSGKPSGEGSAEYKGVAVATEINFSDKNFIQGETIIDIDDLSNPDVDVFMGNWKSEDGSKYLPSAITHEDIPLDELGRFKDDNISGEFGDNGDAVVGRFSHEKFQGVFGATRDTVEIK